MSPLRPGRQTDEELLAEAEVPERLKSAIGVARGVRVLATEIAATIVLITVAAVSVVEIIATGDPIAPVKTIIETIEAITE